MTNSETATILNNIYAEVNNTLFGIQNFKIS